LKALILAGGRGNRIDPVTGGKNKCLIEINNKTILEHNLDLANIPDIDEIIMVVGYKAEDIINKHGIEYKGKKIKYVLQKEQKGVVHAIETAKNLIGNDDFILFLGDQVLSKAKIQDMIREFKEKGHFAVCGVVKESDHSKISKTYSLMVDENGKIHRLFEKPRNPTGKARVPIIWITYSWINLCFRKTFFSILFLLHFSFRINIHPMVIFNCLSQNII
jgi:NDP-sugar pyrophosphorylase family protein